MIEVEVPELKVSSPPEHQAEVWFSAVPLRQDAGASMTLAMASRGGSLGPL